jgi:ATP-dependent helicase/nuclease subunit A
MSLPPDQPQREAAIRERVRNVVVDAGAGTGKTTLLVSRLLEMIAPQDDACAALPLGRIAAVTFTRKAAGELRLRIRERLLSELSATAPTALSSTRRDRLRAALAELDTAHIGTVHAFADRLLRRHPVESRLSPAYDIVEDEEPLLRETYDTLVTKSEKGTLSADLTGRSSEARADEARETVLMYLGAGLQADTLELEYTSRFGLDAIVGGLIRSRDVPLNEPPAPPFMRAAFQNAANAAAAALAGASGDHHPARWMRRASDELRALAAEEDLGAIVSRLMRMKKTAPKNPTLSGDFQDDEESWEIWKTWNRDKLAKPAKPGKNGKPGKPAEEAQDALERAVYRPILRLMARRLARLRPVVLDLYEQVKERHRAVDQIDLLVKLRDLLRDDRAVRGEYQRLFDHIFIDEFQDTDPLQAEIALFLCEATPLALRWQDVKLGDGRLTIVGDPKQSIYRFRRADVSMYARVRELVGRGALSVTLSASFRARPPLIDYLNERFNQVLGEPQGDQIFNPEKGSVANQSLDKGRPEVAVPKGETAPPPVRILELLSDEDTNADGWREIEARALARYLRWLVEKSGLSIDDPNDGHARRVRFGDIAVLAVATTTLRGLFDELDGMGVPHVSRGGTLFLRDPLHQQFLLGLRAIADRDDGIAEAALMRPPFFAVDLADVAHARAGAGRDYRKGQRRRARRRRSGVAAGRAAPPLRAITGRNGPGAPGGDGVRALRRPRTERRPATRPPA